MFDLDASHQAQVSNDRAQIFSDRIFEISEQMSTELGKWFTEKDTKANNVQAA